MTRPRKCTVLLLALSVLSPATLAASPVGTPTAEATREQMIEGTRARRPATEAELNGYAERERQAEGLEDFEGGRMSRSDKTTLIIVLLAVILVVLII